MVKKTSNWLSLFCLIVAFWSCSERPYYESFVSASDFGWEKDSLATFEFNIEDTSKPYRMEVKIRHNNQYPYQNLFLFREVSSRRGIEYTDTANWTLADNFGKWLGDGFGEIKMNASLLGKGSLYFRKPGLYKVTIQQGMRMDTLPGIMDIGLAVYQLNPENNE